MASFVSTLPAAFASGLTMDTIFSSSSEAYRLGTSPLFRMLLMSSRKVSVTI